MSTPKCECAIWWKVLGGIVKMTEMIVVVYEELMLG